MAGLQESARQNHLGGARFTAIGAFEEATLGYFDWQSKEYPKIPIREQVEVLSLVGDMRSRTESQNCMPMWCLAGLMGPLGEGICSRPTSGRRSRSCSSSPPSICTRNTIPKVAWS